jgi:uncharacterized membrane protein (DUF4010 family)
VDAWQAVAVALAIGFVIGSQRARVGGPMGVRIFALAGLAGAGAALVHPVVLGFAVAGTAVITVAGQQRSAAAVATDRPGAGPSGESGDDRARRVEDTVALVLTVLLGGLAVTLPAVAVAAGVATALILTPRHRLPRGLRVRLHDLELANALKFLVVAFLALPLLPHAHLGPHGVLDPRRMWTFVVAVIVVGWLGYVIVRLAGDGVGLAATGLAGGFVSSAATTGAMARASRDPRRFRPAMAGALLASVASLVQLVVVTAVADTRVASLLVPAAALGAAVLIAEAAWLLVREPGAPLLSADVRARLHRLDAGDGTAGPGTDGDALPRARTAVAPLSPAGSDAGAVVVAGGTVTAIDFGASRAPEADRSTVEQPTVDEATRELPPVRRRVPRRLVGRRPFDLVPAVLLIAILAVFLVLAAAVEYAAGPGAAVLVISLAGLADPHAGGLTAANLSSQATLSTHTAALATILALAASAVVKLVLAHLAGGRRASSTLAALFAAPAVAIAVGLLVTLGV